MYLFFDTETTGLPKKWQAPVSDLDNWPRIVQLAWILSDDKGKQLAGQNYIIKPEGFLIPEESSRVHGISTEKAMNEGIALEKALSDLVGYLKTLSPLLQEEYKPFVASRLSISPSLIKLNSNQNIQLSQNQPQTRKKDMWELTIIKTILENPSLSDMILDVLDPSLLVFHRFEFDLAINGQKEHPLIMDILLDDSIKPLNDYESLKNELIAYLIKHYERELKKLNFQKNIPFEQKTFLIRKFRDKISRLKKGNLVSLGE